MSELNFGRVLRRTPLFRNDPAVKDLGNGHEATYGEHLDRVGKLCAILASLGVGPSDRIAVLADSIMPISSREAGQLFRDDRLVEPSPSWSRLIQRSAL